MGFISRIQHAWNAFTNRDPTSEYKQIYSQGITYSTRPDRVRFTRGNERSIITSVYNRIAVDAASINVSHVRLDENDRFICNMVSGLQECLTVEANIELNNTINCIYKSYIELFKNCSNLSKGNVLNILYKVRKQYFPAP